MSLQSGQNDLIASTIGFLPWPGNHFGKSAESVNQRSGVTSKDSIPLRHFSPYGIEARTFVELVNKLMPEMREHRVRTAHATKTGGLHWQLEQKFKFGYIQMEDLPRLMPWLCWRRLPGTSAEQ